MTLVVIWGIIGAVFISFEIMCNKWLMIRRNINGDITGMFFLLVEGTLGTLSLIIATANGKGYNDLGFDGFSMI